MRALLRGVDAYPALTNVVAEDLAAIAGTPDRTAALKWGPDPDWYPRRDGIGRGVIAAGVSERDLETFALAVRQTQVPAWIVTNGPGPPPDAGPRARVITSGLRHLELTQLYAQARVVAIPLRVQWPWNLRGLTSITDALGMGKPVIVTRTPWLDIDVEALGIGIWVQPGDVNGWRDAITYLDEHADVAQQMGQRARALVDSGEYSSHTFADQIMNVFERVLS